MKQLTSLAVLFVAATLVSFKAPPPATTTTTNEIVPFATIIFVPCANNGAGELVQVEGSLHILDHVTVNGNNFSVKTHAQPQSVQGVGLTTGDKYNATGVTQEQFGGSFVNGQAESTFINRFNIIGQGPNNNFHVRQTIHVTVNANGVVTSQVDNTTIDCN